MTQQATISIITATKPARLSKGFSLGVCGDLIKSPGGYLLQGMVETRDLETLADLSAILQALTPAQALVYGVPIDADTRVMTRRAFADAGRPEGVTTRTSDAFRWPQGPGVMMLDYDPAAGCDPLNRDGLVQGILTAAPGLAAAAMSWWPAPVANASRKPHCRRDRSSVAGPAPGCWPMCWSTNMPTTCRCIAKAGSSTARGSI